MSIPIVEALFAWVNGVSISIAGFREIRRKNAHALWTGCTFTNFDKVEVAARISWQLLADSEIEIVPFDETQVRAACRRGMRRRGEAPQGQYPRHA